MGAHPAYTAGVTVTGGNTGALAAGAYVAARHHRNYVSILYRF